MKIQWLDAACDEALLIRGVLWWRRVAHVAYKAPDGYAAREWQFVPSGDPVPYHFASWLMGRRLDARNWQKPPPKRPYLPPAMVVRSDRTGEKQ